MIDYSRLDALNLHLSNVRIRLTNAKTDKERELRKVWVAGLEKEIAAERKFLGLYEVEEEIDWEDLDAFVVELSSKTV